MAGDPAPSQGSLLDDDHRDAMTRAGHLLASRPRTEHEIRQRLGLAGYADDVVERTVTRLLELRLLDDKAFALQWVTERAVSKGRSGDALVAELGAKGIPRDMAEQAVAEAGLDELAQATEIASRALPKVAGRPLEAQAQALLGRLLRRGYPHEVARDAVRAVLPPEGWD